MTWEPTFKTHDAKTTVLKKELDKISYYDCGINSPLEQLIELDKKTNGISMHNLDLMDNYKILHMIISEYIL